MADKPLSIEQEARYLGIKRLRDAIEAGEVQASGKLPELYLETEKIVDPESAEGQAFQKQMEGILKTIRPGYFSPTGELKRQVRFVLADTEDKDAYIVPSGKAIVVVCLSKGMLKFCKSEDEIAHLIGHEMQHDDFSIRFGDGPNSLPEELGCNILPLNWMLEKRGDSFAYNIEAASNFADRLALKVDDKWEQRMRSLDVHGMPVMEAEAIRLAVGGLQTRCKNLPAEKPISTELTELVDKAKHVPYFEKFRADHPNFDTLSGVEKLEALTPAVTTFERGMIARARGLREALKQVTINPGNTSEKAAVVKVMDEAVEHPGAFDAVYYALARKLTKGDVEPIGKLAPVRDAVEAFLEAEDKEKACEAAKIMCAALDKLPLEHMGLGSLQWPQFELRGPKTVKAIASKGGKGTPWLDHVEWAKEEIADGNWDVAKALWYVGIAPKDLFDVAEFDQLEHYRTHPPLSNPVIAGTVDYDADQIKLDRDGSIAALRKEGSLKADTANYFGKVYSIAAYNKRQAEAPAKEEEQKPNPGVAVPALSDAAREKIATVPFQPIANVSPDELYVNFVAHYHRNLKVLRSPEAKHEEYEKAHVPAAMRDGKRDSLKQWYSNYEATSALIKGLRTLLAKDKEKYTPFVKAFFAEGIDGCTASYLLDSEKKGISFDINPGMAEGMSVHPLVSYVLEDPDSIFSLEEKAKFAGGSGKYTPLMVWEKAVKPPTDHALSANELKVTLAAYKAAGEELYPLQVFAGELVCNHLRQNGAQKISIAELMLEHPHVLDYAATNDFENNRCLSIWTAKEQHKLTLARDAAIERAKRGETLKDEDVSRMEKRTTGGKVSQDGLHALLHEAARPETLRKNRTILIAAIRKEKHWPDDAEKLASIYKTLELSSLFPDSEWRIDFVNRLSSAIEKIDDLEKRLSILNDLVSGQEIKDVELRNSAISLWANTVKSMLGGNDPGYAKDQAAALAGAPEEEKEKFFTDYHKKLRALVEPVREKAGLHMQYMMFAKLAEIIESQQEISADLGDFSEKGSRDELVKASKKTATSEFLLDLISESKETRTATIDFLLSPLSKDSTDKFAGRLDQEIGNRADKQASTYRAKDEEYADQYLANEIEEIKNDDSIDKVKKSQTIKAYREILREGARESKLLDRLSERAILKEWELKKFSGNQSKLVDLSRLHENFWASPMPVRAVLMKQLLLSADEQLSDIRGEGKTLGSKFQEAMDYVLERTVPIPAPEAGDDKVREAQVLRTFLKAYALSVSEKQAALFLAAVLSAAQQSQEKAGGYNASEMAAKILISLGPAERKIAQAISNSPELSPEITRPFATAKGEGLIVPRWEDLKRMKAVAEPSFFDQVARIGKRLGGASIYTFYETDETTGDKGAFGIREANAKGNSDAGFMVAEKFVENIKQLDPSLAAKIPETLNDILTVAKRHTQDELDAATGLKQHALLHKLYDGVTVTLDDGWQCHYSAAQLKAYGDEFRYQGMIPGEHFMNLPENTEDQKLDKKRRAIAHMTVGLYRWLGGDPEVRGHYDSDDHDAQGRASRNEALGRNEYGRFDPGGINIEPRTEEESRQLARSLVNVLIAHLGGDSLDKAMHEEIQRVRREDSAHKTPEHLISAQRTLLALNKFREAAGNESVVQILASLYQSGQIDPVIRDTITQELQEKQGYIMGKVMELMMSGKLDQKIFQAISGFASPGESGQSFVTITQDKSREYAEPRHFAAATPTLGGAPTLELLEKKSGSAHTGGNGATRLNSNGGENEYALPAELWQNRSARDGAVSYRPK